MQGTHLLFVQGYALWMALGPVEHLLHSGGYLRIVA